MTPIALLSFAPGSRVADKKGNPRELRSTYLVDVWMLGCLAENLQEKKGFGSMTSAQIEGRVLQVPV